MPGRTFLESSGMYWRLSWQWTFDSVAIHARNRDVPFLLGGNDLNGMDCSGLFTYIMNTMGYTYEDRTAQCIFNEIFVYPGWTPPLVGGVHAWFYGTNKSSISHVAFPTTPVSSKYVTHATDAFQAVDGFSGLRTDALGYLKEAWTQGNWYKRWMHPRLLYAWQGNPSQC